MLTAARCPCPANPAHSRCHKHQDGVIRCRQCAEQIQPEKTLPKQEPNE